MIYTLSTCGLNSATIALPASKSINNRSLIISAISGGSIMPTNLSRCDDADVLLSALHDMPYTIDVKASGSAMRFLTSYLSINEGEHVLTGTARMQQRPIKVLVDALLELGANISYVKRVGFPPLLIKGKPLNGGRIQVVGDVSSQYISSLLMIAPTFQNGLTIRLIGDVVSRSYIDLTISMMKEYGANVEWASADTIVVKPQMYQLRPYYVENDWTAASYWYELLAFTKDPNVELTLPGLRESSLQGDAQVKYIFSLLGVKTTFLPQDKNGLNTVVLRRSGMVVSHLAFDFTNCPDVAQTLVCTCCGLGITFDFTGLSTLKIKETDRLVALKTELRKLGFVLHDYGDSRLVWDGERIEPTLEAIDTHEDHRMAMAIAPLALLQEGIKINNPEVVNKSYPNYWEHLRQVSFHIAEI